MKVKNRKSVTGCAPIIVILPLLLLIPKFSHADEWQTLVDDTRLTYAAGDGWHSNLGVDSNGNIHVTWQDNRDVNDEIYYTKLDNNGNTLVDDTRLTFDSAESWWPVLEVDGSGNVHIIWRDTRNGSPEVYYTKLDNNGNVLVDDTRLTNGSNNSNGYNIKVDSYDNLHVAWVDYRNGDPEIYYAKLDNNGNHLVNDTRLTSAIGDSWWPHVGVDNADNVHIAWYDARDDSAEIYYTKLGNNGNTLVDDTRLTFAGCAVGAPHLEVDDSDNVHITWGDNRRGYGEIYYTKLDNMGNTLVDDTPVTKLGISGYWIDMDNEGNVHITWSDDRESNDEIYYSKLDNNGNTLVIDTRLTTDGASSWWPRIGVDSAFGIHIIWDDGRDGNREIYYTKGTVITGICENPNDNTVQCMLSQNYPNPFHSEARISYFIPRASVVKLKIYDINGKQIQTVVDEFQSAGSYSRYFDAGNLPSGVYIYRLQADKYSDMKKMVVVH